MIPRHLTINERTSRKERPCKHCEKLILEKEKYISASVNEMGLKKGYGAFHVSCFEEFKKKSEL